MRTRRCDRGKCLSERRLLCVAIHVEEEDVLPRAPRRRATLDLGEVDFRRGQRREHLEQHAGLVVATRLGRSIRLAEHEETGDIVGSVLNRRTQNVQAVDPRRLFRCHGGADVTNRKPNYLSVMGDQVIGSMGHQLLLARLLKGELKAAIEAELGRPVSDAVDYMGISQGGILGSPLAAVSPDIRRMVLHVGGGAWTAMMTHSSNWTPEEPGGFGYGVAFAGTVPDATQRTLLQSLWQPIWDRWDPALFAGFWTDAPEGIAGPRPPADRRIYYPYAIDDPQVPNFSSETVLREAGGSLVVPSITAPPAIPTLGYADPQPQIVADQWDVGGGQPAHGDVRRLPAFVQAVRDFIRTGTAEDHCSGSACVFIPDDAVGW